MEEDIKKILEENLALTKELRENMIHIRRHLMWQRVFSTIYLIVIVGPLILAAIYLPPLVRPYWEQYQRLFLNLTTTTSQESPNLDALLRQYQASQPQP